MDEKIPWIFLQDTNWLYRLEEQRKRDREKEENRYWREIWEKERNVRRDEKGRLNKGARIAQKVSCKPEIIWSMYKNGRTVKEIAERRSCSKSTVYKVIKECKKREEELKKEYGNI